MDFETFMRRKRQRQLPKMPRNGFSDADAWGFAAIILIIVLTLMEQWL